MVGPFEAAADLQREDQHGRLLAGVEDGGERDAAGGAGQHGHVDRAEFDPLAVGVGGVDKAFEAAGGVAGVLHVEHGGGLAVDGDHLLAAQAERGFGAADGRVDDDADAPADGEADLAADACRVQAFDHEGEAAFARRGVGRGRDFEAVAVAGAGGEGEVAAFDGDPRAAAVGRELVGEVDAVVGVEGPVVGVEAVLTGLVADMLQLDDLAQRFAGLDLNLDARRRDVGGKALGQRGGGQGGGGQRQAGGAQQGAAFQGTQGIGAVHRAVPEVRGASTPSTSSSK